MGRTTQRLADRIKQHVPTSIRKKSNTVREQPPRLCKNNNPKIKCESAIGQHLLTNPECAKTDTDYNFRIIGQARSSFQLSPNQTMPTFFPTNANIVGHLLGIAGYCRIWCGQMNPTLVPNIYLLITATTTTTTTTQDRLLYSYVPNARPLPPLISLRIIFQPLLLFGATPS